MSGARPPRWLERILGWALPRGLSGQGTLGDLAEEFGRQASDSPFRAQMWYARQAFSILAFRAVAKRGAGTSARREGVLGDLSWSMRAIRRHPRFSFGVAAVLGLGLGANAAVYSVMDGTLRHTRWWSAPDATVAVWPDRGFSFGHLELYAEQQSVYRALGGYSELAFALRGSDGQSESVNGVLITPQLFRELATQPTLGRTLADDDGTFGAEPVVVIGDGLWRRAFGADPAIVGRRIIVSGGAATVVGIQGVGGAAPGGRAELWRPLVVDPRDDDFWKAQSNKMVGVLRAGADLDDAFTDLMAFTDRLSQLFPMFYPQGFATGIASVTRADEAQRQMISTPLLLLSASTAVLMLVTALNVGNLLLGRAIHRRRELAVRAAIGASRARIVRQLLVEGFVLTIVALGLGLVIGSLGGPWIARLFVAQAVVASSSVLSPSVLGFSLAIAALAWLVLNAVPVAHFLRTHDLGLHGSAGTNAGMQRGLVAGQAALATLLLVSATLLVATVNNIRQVPLGFETHDLITVELSPPEDRVESAPTARALYARLTERVRAIPGVQAAGLTGWLPLRAQAPTTPINLRAAPVDPREATSAPMHMVDPGFFETLAIRASRGRLLGTRDQASTPSAVVVNETLAETLWPGGVAVGQLIAIDPHAWDTWVPVVGVVPDVRSGTITGPAGPALYVALAESPSRDVTLVVRAVGTPAELGPALKRAVSEADPLVPIRGVSGMKEVVRSAYATSWVMMGLLIVLAVLATAIGAIGIYAVLTQHVALTRREIGVRMALGAQPGAVVGGVVRSGLLLAGIGIVFGSVAAAVSTRLLESLLFEVSTLAPLAFVAPAVALSVAAGLAAWIPASRAGRLPPADVLRSD